MITRTRLTLTVRGIKHETAGLLTPLPATVMKPTTKLAIVIAISIAFFVTEIASQTTIASLPRLSNIDTVGFRTKSLALIADAVSPSEGIQELPPSI